MNTNEEKLRQEILGDAERHAERTLARARSDAQKALEQVRTDHAALATQRLAEADTEGEERYQAITSSIVHDLRNGWLKHRETVVADLLDQALTHAEELGETERRESLRQLLSEALEAIGQTAMTIRANAECARLLDENTIETAATAAWKQRGHTVVNVIVDPELRPGLVAESTNGRRLFDNTYVTRLARLRAELRALVDTAVGREEDDKQGHD